MFSLDIQPGQLLLVGAFTTCSTILLCFWLTDVLPCRHYVLHFSTSQVIEQWKVNIIILIEFWTFSLGDIRPTRPRGTFPNRRRLSNSQQHPSDLSHRPLGVIHITHRCIPHIFHTRIRHQAQTKGRAPEASAHLWLWAAPFQEALHSWGN